MVSFSEGSLFESNCDCLVNPVNTDGVMGKGLALLFKKKYPEMFHEYKILCLNKRIQVGKVYVWENEDSFPLEIMLFPTKLHYYTPSKIEYISNGLDFFIENIHLFQSKSFAFPALGAGLGGLDWETVKSVMVEKLSQSNREFIIFNPKK